MGTVSAALLRSGIVNENDIARVETPDEVDREIEREREKSLRALEVRFNNALNSNTMGREIAEWINSTGKLVSFELLERWADLDEREQLIEWSKWLAAYREVCETKN